jgi:hypothetical protein
MKTLGLSLLALGVAVLLGSSATAQTLKGGGLSGTVFTVTASAPGNSSVDAYTAPSGIKPEQGGFLVTQICVDDKKDMELTGNTMGEIPLADDCTVFSPGLALPPSEVLTFTDSSGSAHPIVITGIRWTK